MKSSRHVLALVGRFSYQRRFLLIEEAGRLSVGSLPVRVLGRFGAGERAAAVVQGSQEASRLGYERDSFILVESGPGLLDLLVPAVPAAGEAFIVHARHCMDGLAWGVEPGPDSAVAEA
jgi:hypothetical protein